MTLKTRRKILRTVLAAACLFCIAQDSRALNYSPGDLLLVFRKDNQKDIEFNLGPISNYLAQPNGTKIPVSFNTNAVATNYNNSLTGVRFAVISATAQTDNQPRVWVSDASLFSTPADLTFSAFGVLRDKIESVGIAATIQTASNAAPYVVNTSASTSYDYLVTSGINSAVSTMYGDSPVPVNGITPLPVDAVSPQTISLYEGHISAVNPKPASKLIGAFTLDLRGNLYFTAGQLPSLPASTITSIDADLVNETTSISFVTTNGVSYRLLSSPSLSGGWSAVPGAGTTAGDGTIQSLIDYNPPDQSRYYRIQTIY